VARVAIVPYAIAYSMLDAIAGVALGQVVREANGMSAADAAVVQRILDGNGGQDYIGIVIWVASGLTWFVMALAAAMAVKRIGGLGPTLLMAIGAAIFAVGHPFPPGPIGIALFGLGVAWLEVVRARAPIPEAQPVLVP
jgi:CHASE2 domain-containing sensor protein